jgi:hypothetical protein
MEKNMTTKEIAAAVGKAEKTARTWVMNLSAKSATIEAKLAASSPMNPARYTLAEVCEIIEEGMGADVAGAFRVNATAAEMVRPSSGRMNGKQMEYLYKMAASGMISPEEVKAMLGVCPVAAPLQIEGPASLPSKIEKQIYGIAHNVVRKYFAEETAKLLNGDLFKL